MSKIMINEKKISEIIRNERIEYYKKKIKLDTILNIDVSEIIINKIFEENYKDGFYKMSLKNYLKFTQLKLHNLEIDKIDDQSILFYNKTDFIGEEILNLQSILTNFLKNINYNYSIKIDICDYQNKIIEKEKNKIVKEQYKILSLEDDNYSLYIHKLNVYSFISKPLLYEKHISIIKKYLIDKNYDYKLLKKFFQVDNLSEISFRTIILLKYNLREKNFPKITKNSFRYLIMEMPNGQLILVYDFLKIINDKFNLVSTDNKKNSRKNFYSVKDNFITFYSQYPFTGLQKIYNDECDKYTSNELKQLLFQITSNKNFYNIRNSIMEYNKLLNY
jgi:hypothetical protein